MFHVLEDPDAAVKAWMQFEKDSMLFWDSRVRQQSSNSNRRSNLAGQSTKHRTDPSNSLLGLISKSQQSRSLLQDTRPTTLNRTSAQLPMALDSGIFAQQSLSSWIDGGPHKTSLSDDETLPCSSSSQDLAVNNSLNPFTGTDVFSCGPLSHFSHQHDQQDHRHHYTTLTSDDFASSLSSNTLEADSMLGIDSASLSIVSNDRRSSLEQAGLFDMPAPSVSFERYDITIAAPSSDNLCPQTSPDEPDFNTLQTSDNMASIGSGPHWSFLSGQEAHLEPGLPWKVYSETHSDRLDRHQQNDWHGVQNLSKCKIPSGHQQPRNAANYMDRGNSGISAMSLSPVCGSILQRHLLGNSTVGSCIAMQCQTSGPTAHHTPCSRKRGSGLSTDAVPNKLVDHRQYHHLYDWLGNQEIEHVQPVKHHQKPFCPSPSTSFSVSASSSAVGDMHIEALPQPHIFSSTLIQMSGSNSNIKENAAPSNTLKTTQALVPTSSSSSSSSSATALTSAASSASPPESEANTRNAFLIECKRRGMSYKDIKRLGNFREAESTLRGRFRTLTKAKDQRVRKPKWHDRDIQLLCQAVSACSTLPCNGRDRPGSRVQCVLKTQLTEPPNVSWKKIGQYIWMNGGSYHFGNATVKKKWCQIHGLQG